MCNNNLINLHTYHMQDENNHSSTKNIIVEDNASAETFKYLFSKVLYPEFNYTFMVYNYLNHH